jgi:hypothetical protein
VLAELLKAGLLPCKEVGGPPAKFQGASEAQYGSQGSHCAALRRRFWRGVSKAVGRPRLEGSQAVLRALKR